jgi:hypothetical protein
MVKVISGGVVAELSIVYASRAVRGAGANKPKNEPMHNTNFLSKLRTSLVGSLLLAAVSGSAWSASLPPGFSDTQVTRPDGRAWENVSALAFASDSRMFVAERGGRLWVVGGTAAVAQPLIDLSSEVSTMGALGLTGLTLDPQFEQNGYIYLFFSVDPEFLANCISPVTGAVSCRAGYRPGHATSGATIGRLVRYQLIKPTGAVDYHTASQLNEASRRVLLGENPAGGGAPTGCVVTDTAQGPGALAFGNDGSLLAACGDGASAHGEDAGSAVGTAYAEALAAHLMSAAENVGAFRAQLVDSLSGKILRLDAATGDGLPSNPFYEASAPRAARSRVFVLGLHDPQHFTVRPDSGGTQPANGRPGTLYIGDVGAIAWESLAVARAGRMNFGWPLYEGVGDEPTPYAGLPAFNLDAPNSLAGGGCALPYFRFRDLISPESAQGPAFPNPCRASVDVPAADDVFVRERPAIDWLHSGADARWAAVDAFGEPLALMLGTRAPNGSIVTGALFGGTLSIGGVWYESSSFPAPYRNVYFHADSGGEWIKAFLFDADDNPTSVLDFLASGGPIRALAASPANGSLYYVTGASGAEVHLLTYGLETPAASTAQSAARAGRSTSAAIPSTITAAPKTTASTTSASVTATPRSTTPATMSAAANPAASPTWTSTDIGAVYVAGSFTQSGGTFTVKGAGSDIWGNADAFQFVSTPMSGNGSITARVVSQTQNNAWAKAGVMIRETLNAGASFADVEITPGNGVVYQGRTSTGALATTIQGPIVHTPYWVRVVRSGTTFTGYLSPDGSTWTSLGTYTSSMASQVYVGLAVTSHANLAAVTDVFDNVTVSGSVTSTPSPSVPTGLAASNVTTSSVALSWNASTDAGGPGVGGYYVYRNGNTSTPLATVTSGTTYTDTTVAPSTAYTYQVAAFDTATPANVSAPSTAINVSTPSAGGGGTTWTGGDIGAVGIPGSFTQSGGTFTVKGSGADIWGTADAFQFVSTSLTGNGSITARVVGQYTANSWTKAGVMIRETLGASSSYAAVEVTPGNGVVYQARTSTGAYAVTTQGPMVASPYWVRVVRSGTTFTGYASANGSSWTQIGTYTANMASQVYVGLAVTSHANLSLTTAVFDNINGGSGSSTVTLSPLRAALTLSQSAQFSASTANGQAITWSVDGVAGGNASVGTISGSGLYNPPATAGVHTVTATSADQTSSANATVAVTDLNGIYTYHADAARTGQNLHEYALTPSMLTSGNFGKRWSCPLDGEAYAQPLYVANLNIGGGTHNIVIVATMHDSVYAFDADSSSCITYWKASFLTAGATTIPSPDNGCGDISPEYGITGTPVINPATNTLYLVAATKESGNWVQRLHALNVATGADVTTPTVISASVTNKAGKTVAFSPLFENQRGGLALSGNGVYVIWGSHCDNGPWYGWMMRFDATSLAQTAYFNSAPDGGSAGIWMSGGAPAIDAEGSFYVSTGNGSFDDQGDTLPAHPGGDDFGMSYLRLDPSTLTVKDFYTPSKEAGWSADDLDISSSGVTVLPDGTGPSGHPNVIVGSDKQGHLWMIDRTDMQEYNSTTNNVVQYLQLPGGAGVFSTMAYWNGTVYVVPNGFPVMALKLSNGLIPANSGNAVVPTSEGKDTFAFPGPSPMISASPGGNAVVWALDNNASQTGGVSILRAYDATNVGSELYSSATLAADKGGILIKFTLPVIANGHVYVAGSNQLTVYGLAP